MNRHFVDTPISYAIGDLIAATAAAATEPAWEQHPILADYEVRTVNGMPEARLKPSLQTAAAAKAEPKRDEPYCPEGWGGFEYHDRKGAASPVIKPAKTVETTPPEAKRSAEADKRDVGRILSLLDGSGGGSLFWAAGSGAWLDQVRLKGLP
jgi:hypothetical protein